MTYVSKARRKKPELREPVPGNGTALPPGKTHKVTIDYILLTDGSLTVRFKDSFDEYHKEYMFMRSKDGDDLSGLLKQLIAATALDSFELKEWYSILVGNDIPRELTGRSCTIETEYRGDYVNIKTIRSGDDRDNGGSFFQSIEADSPHEKGTPDTGQPKQYIAVSESVTSFF